MASWWISRCGGGKFSRRCGTAAGMALRVANDAILDARRNMHGRGFMIETTSAAPVAALPQIRERLGDVEIVIALTGSGLKSLAG